MQIYFGQESYRWSSMFFPLIIVILNVNKNKEKIRQINIYFTPCADHIYHYSVKELGFLNAEILSFE